MLCTVCVCGAQALTTWLVASDAEEDVSLSQGLDPATWERHFSDGGEAVPGRGGGLAGRLARGALEQCRAAGFGLLRRLGGGS